MSPGPASNSARSAGAVILTDVPARLDALRWSRFHWLVVGALGVTWILDGLEVTIVGSLSGALGDKRTLALTAGQIGLAGSAYLVGGIVGALVFGRLTDLLGRKRLFTITLAVYLLATLATGLSWNFASFMVFRALTGAGIGGEGAAMNSAIQELIPARLRGRIDITINGSFWVGAALGALGSVVLLNPRLIPVELGWRLTFIGGAVLSLVVIYARRFLPESPRWLMTHGRIAEAEQVVGEIERKAHAPDGALAGLPRIALMAHAPTGLAQVARSLILQYPTRTALGVILLATQAFCYNAIFFTYGSVLTKFFAVPSQDLGWFLLPFAVGNFMGPLLLGPLFDSIGRKPMIAATYAISGILLAITGWLFAAGVFSAATLTLAWTVVFFFASAAASAAYLTVAESFPLEMRAMVIALFYALGSAIGGVAGPAVFGYLIETGSPRELLVGYLFGGALMLVAAVTELFIGVAAERKPLELVARPLSQVDTP